MRRREVICLLLAANVLSVSAVRLVQAEAVQPEQVECTDVDPAENGEDEEISLLPPEQEAEVELVEEIQETVNDESDGNEDVNEPEDPESEKEKTAEARQPIEQAVSEPEELKPDRSTEEEIENEHFKPEVVKENVQECETLPEEYFAMPEEVKSPETAALLVPELVKPKEPPQITIENVRMGSANSLPVAPNIRIRSRQLDEESIEIRILDADGRVVQNSCELIQDKDEMLFSLSAINKDGIYTLYVKGIDLNGNLAETKYVFSVNKSGTSFRYNQKQSAQKLNQYFTPEIELKNIDEITILTCMNNGKEADYQFTNGVLSVAPEAVCAGKNKITLEVRDSAGNISVMKPWEFYIDKTASS